MQFIFYIPKQIALQEWNDSTLGLHLAADPEGTQPRCSPI